MRSELIQYMLPMRVDRGAPTLQACFARLLSDPGNHSTLSIVIPENVDSPEIAEWWLGWIYPHVSSVWVEEYADCVGEIEQLSDYAGQWVPTNLKGKLKWRQYTTSVRDYSGPVIATTGCLLRHIKEQPQMLEHMYHAYRHITNKERLWEIFLCYECGYSYALGFSATGHKFVDYYSCVIGKFIGIDEIISKVKEVFPVPWHDSERKFYMGSTSIFNELCHIRPKLGLDINYWKGKIDEIVDGQ